MAGIDLLCLEDAACFPLFYFFRALFGSERLVLSLFLLRPNKSSQQPLTLVTLGAIAQSNRGIINESWELVSVRKQT